ncbi:MAG: glycine--tRNA ligase subunit beta [Chloroflexi bacterium]|nr:glycine--tRNA ligase subunit beta [Chloroflexota bacterium]
MLTFQDAVFALERFWASEGCLIWEPYYLQVGAGTMNPATFLRVLGPEPWRVAYVEPSVRPDDARYGENPNRMGLHYQYQVILKPEPGDPQELYLRSLEALGIDSLKHDIRFVEDNWEQPALGAWGLGWEVWLDGLEITQFTYFQQAGGQALDPVSVELTYGLERILMAIQGVAHFGDIQWDDRRTYGDLNLAAEQQHSRYYFEVADVEQLRNMFDGYEAEADRALQAGLTLPAYDQLLKCSHTFNVLDTRGSVGVTDRAAYFGRMRRIARAVAELYLQEREQAGYPWLEPDALMEPVDETEEMPGPDRRSAFILEVGTEELPASDQIVALEQLENSIESMLTATRLEHGPIRVMGTPRRLIALVEDLAPRQSSRDRILKGPPWAKVYDADGKPTPTAAGFASRSGVEVEELREQEMDGGTYAVAAVREEGGPARQALADALPGVIAGLRFDKAMRWDRSGTTFSRPIRWLLAVHGESVVPFKYGSLRSGRTGRGLRGSDPIEINIEDVEAYFKALEAQEIIADPELRRSEIQKQIERLSSEVSGFVAFDAELLQEVTNLVEAPQALLGKYEEAFLDLPREVLIAVMKVHQRYFPLESNGKLLPNFILVSNGRRGSTEIVVSGNEDVIRARFADAKYFVARDLEQSLESYVDKLRTLTFQTDLGSMLDKTHRLEARTATLAEHLNLSDSDGQAAVRAARLCKADLATLMVIDMTSLQGSMGRYYAGKSGETEGVAQAIFEHYLPRFAGDEMPASDAGIVLALADRLDSLIGFFSVGVHPTGTRDPFGLRRSAVGLVQILVERNLSLDLSVALSWAWDGYDRGGEVEALDNCLAFIIRRHRQLLLDQGVPHDVVAAVIEEQGPDPLRATRAGDELKQWVTRDDWAVILQAYSRSARITRDLAQTYEFDEKRVEEASTRALLEALTKAENAGRDPASIGEFLTAFEPMIPAIDRFFEDVMVMTEDKSLRENRLALLQRVVQLASGVVDLSRLEGF